MAVVRRTVGVKGCDDAPYVSVPMGTEPKRVTFVVPYYENPATLVRHLDRWSAISLTAPLAVIVVDDGSPECPAEPILKGRELPFSLRLYRIEVDVRWNWLAARNLGMEMAAEGWCVLTDIDHFVPSVTFLSLAMGRHDPATIYRFSRREHTGERIKPHPNSWFMTRAMFWRIGGYDETLSGHYGTDGEYRRRAAATAPIRILTDELDRHEFVLDSSTTRYLRKQPEDAAVAKLIAARGPDWKPRTLSFPWRRVLL